MCTACNLRAYKLQMKSIPQKIGHIQGHELRSSMCLKVPTLLDSFFAELHMGHAWRTPPYFVQPSVVPPFRSMRASDAHVSPGSYMLLTCRSMA